jgi:hypothetical protein
VPWLAKTAAPDRIQQAVANPRDLRHFRHIGDRTICVPPRMLAVTVAAVAQRRSSGGAGLPFRASVAPRKSLRDVPTSKGYAFAGEWEKITDLHAPYRRLMGKSAAAAAAGLAAPAQN